MNVGANIILDAIAEKNLSSADAVTAATGAGSGCGSCKPEIQRLLEQANWKRPHATPPLRRPIPADAKKVKE